MNLKYKRTYRILYDSTKDAYTDPVNQNNIVLQYANEYSE